MTKIPNYFYPMHFDWPQQIVGTAWWLPFPGFYRKFFFWVSCFLFPSRATNQSLAIPGPRQNGLSLISEPAIRKLQTAVADAIRASHLTAKTQRVSCVKSTSCFTRIPSMETSLWMGDPSRSLPCELDSRALMLAKVPVREFGSLDCFLPARNCIFEEGGIYLTGWGRVSRFEKRLRKEATHDMINAVVIVNSTPCCWTCKKGH